jgi:hypothetical protein
LPLREFSVNPNVTRTTKSKTNDENNTVSDVELSPVPKLIDSQIEENNASKKIEKSVAADKNDRYLNENEIKTISKLLHNVKKSDLEAIVDIYSLAQDIYKEMDKGTPNEIPDEEKPSKKAQAEDKRYWYEPLNRVKTPVDMDTQASNGYATVANPPAAEPNIYFQGPLMKNDFGTLPYYYPMTDFQRQASYVYNGYKQPQQIQKPCTTQVPKTYPVVVSPYSQMYSGVIKKPFTVETQRVVQPLLLPYPFSYIQQHSNMSAYPFNSYYDSPLTQFDVHNKNHHLEADNNKLKIDFKEADNKINTIEYKQFKPNHFFANDLNKKPDSRSKSYKKEDKKVFKEKTLLDTLFEHAKIEFKKPDWQTDPLSANVLEDIRAHFEDKANILKPFSFRKKVKLERVGKVKKLDDLNRDKRSADTQTNLLEAEDNLETYLEKTM